MKYEDFEKFVREKCVYETIYDDSEGERVLIIHMIDAYCMVNKAQVCKAVGDEGINSLELTTRSWNCLRVEGIFTIAQLLECTANELLLTPNFGRKSLKEIIGKLKARGLKLKEKNISNYLMVSHKKYKVRNIVKVVFL
jgi:DNA-directed RNA polymerase alpha subunit